MYRRLRFCWIVECLTSSIIWMAWPLCSSGLGTVWNSIGMDRAAETCQACCREPLARLAGLAVTEVGEVKCPFWYPNEHALLDGLLESGLGRQALRVASADAVRRAVLEGLAGYRTSTGGYRLDKTFRYLVGSSAQT